MKALIHHAFWLAHSYRWSAFKLALKRPEEAQRGRLHEILRAARDTEVGKRLGFGQIHDVREFQERVPLTDHEDLRDPIARMRGGEKDVLFAGQARLFEPSGGSAGGVKRIPYNDALAAEFRNGLGPWLFDLYRRYPELRAGSAYWSISPATQEEGFESDASYLGGSLESLASKFLAVPPSVARIKDLEGFKARTLEHLTAARDLSFISVWNPSFLTLLLEGVKEPAALWPRLRLISCWTDGHAGTALPKLKALFPGVEIQPKGLLATEAFVTLPFEGSWPLSLRSHFFEFLDASQRPACAWELQEGRDYSVVVTTGGGLYRYRLKDRVRVEGFIARTPSLRFVGKEDGVSDCVGEKLEEAHVAASLRQASDELGLSPPFALLAPELEAGAWRYVLYLEGTAPAAYLAALERGLQGNSCYAQARRLGQLGPLLCRSAPLGSAERYLKWRTGRGQRLGSVKALALETGTAVHDIFSGDF